MAPQAPPPPPPPPTTEAESVTATTTAAGSTPTEKRPASLLVVVAVPLALWRHKRTPAIHTESLGEPVATGWRQRRFWLPRIFAPSTTHRPSSSPCCRLRSPVGSMLLSFPLLLLFHNATESLTRPKQVEWRPLGPTTSPDLRFLDTVANLPNTNVQIGHHVNGPTPTSKGHRHRQRQPPDSLHFKVAQAFHRRSQADGTEELLYRTLLNPEYYEKNVRPTTHHTVPTNITFGFLLNQIVEMDERNQVLTTRCWLNVNWLDKRLSWNSSEWEGIKTLYIPHKKLWTPDIILVNNAVREYYGSILSTDIMTTSEGNVTWLFSALFKSSCPMRVRYYPFDSQICELRFSSWSHDMSEIDLGLTTNQGDLSSYLNSTEFDLTEMSAMKIMNIFPTDNTSHWPTITITIKMERRPLFYVFNHILPCVLISSMAVFGFSMPPETGEKINLSITTMLSMGVYLQSITESIPPTSEAVPLIGQYYVASLTIVCLATAINVMSLNVHRTGVLSQGRHVPWWMEKFILGYLATALCITIHEPDSITLLKSSQAKQSTIRRSSLLRDLKRIRNRENCRGSSERERQVCECLLVNVLDAPRSRRLTNSVAALAETELIERVPAAPGESAFLQRVVKEQVMPRMSPSTRPPMFNEFEERFKRILKRIYRSLQQREIRDEILDERRRIMWQWGQLATVVDRFLLVLFSLVTLATIGLFLVFPVTVLDSLNHPLY